MKFTIDKIRRLFEEIKGNTNTGMKGLLNEEIKLGTKYKLHKILTAITSIVETTENLKVELIKKYGDDNGDGTYSIKVSNDPESRNSFTEFSEEFNELMSKEEEINISKLKFEEIENVESTSAYEVIFEILE